MESIILSKYKCDILWWKSFVKYLIYYQISKFMFVDWHWLTVGTDEVRNQWPQLNIWQLI